MAIDVTGVDVSKQQVTMAFALVIPNQLLAQEVYNGKTGEHIDLIAAIQNNDQWATESLSLKYWTVSNSAPRYETVTVPFRDAISIAPQKGWLDVTDFSFRSVDLSIGTSANNYPHDSYGWYHEFTLTLPSPLVFKNDLFHENNSAGLPLTVAAPVEDINLANAYSMQYGVGTDPGCGCKARGASISTLSIQVKRSDSTRLLTYGIAFIPLMLAALLADLVWRHALAIEAVLGLVVAASFTVLPLRTVLVPSGVGLTLLDDLLAGEVVALSWVGAWAYWLHALRDERTE